MGTIFNWLWTAFWSAANAFVATPALPLFAAAAPHATAFRQHPVRQFVRLISRDHNNWFWFLLGISLALTARALWQGAMGEPISSIHWMIWAIGATLVFIAFLATGLAGVFLYIWFWFTIGTFGVDGLKLILNATLGAIRAIAPTNVIRSALTLIGVPAEHINEIVGQLGSPPNINQEILTDAGKFIEKTFGFAKKVVLTPLLATLGLLVVQIGWICLESIFQFGFDADPEMISWENNQLLMTGIVTAGLVAIMAIIGWFSTSAWTSETFEPKKVFHKLAMACVIFIIIGFGINYGLGHNGKAKVISFGKVQELKADAEERATRRMTNVGVVVTNIPAEDFRRENNFQADFSQAAKFFPFGTSIAIKKEGGKIKVMEDPVTLISYIVIRPDNQAIQKQMGRELKTVWVAVPEDDIKPCNNQASLTTSGLGGSRGWQHCRLDPQGRGKRVVKVAQGDIVTIRAALQDSTVLGKYTGTTNLIKCGLSGVGDPGELANMKYPQYRLGVPVVSYPGGPQALTDDSVVLINVQADGELWVEINEVTDPDGYPTNTVRAEVEYEIHHPL